MSTTDIRNVCIVGSGFMGTRIGWQCAEYGYTVWFYDISEQMLSRAADEQMADLTARVAAGEMNETQKEDARSRTYYTGNFREAAEKADLVVEAAPEVLELKREIFARLDEVCPPHAILATTSSSIRISRIEDAVKRPGRVLNAHFFSRRMPLVELMRGTQTSEEVFERMRQFALSLDILPLIVQKDSTGFIINRVWRAVKREALRVVAEGVASPDDLDRAWVMMMGGSMGPCGRMDRVGLDVVRDIEMVYYNESGDEKDAPPRFLHEMVARGELGMKSGKGFYEYPNPRYEDEDWLMQGIGKKK